MHGFGKMLLVFRQLTGQKQLGHAQDAIHRGPDFMAHIGQKLGFGAASGLRRLFSMTQGMIAPDQFGGALRHLNFKMITVLGQLPVPLLHLGQHGVKAVNEAADFVVALLGRPDGVVIGL